MALLDDLQNASLLAPNMGGKCLTCELLKQLPDPERELLEHLLATDKTKVPGSAIARILGNNGHPIKAQNVNRHRNGECRGAR